MDGEPVASSYTGVSPGASRDRLTSQQKWCSGHLHISEGKVSLMYGAEWKHQNVQQKVQYSLIANTLSLVMLVQSQYKSIKISAVKSINQLIKINRI